MNGWALVLGSLGFFLSLLNFGLAERRERLRHVTSISVFESFATGDITEENHSEFIIRNDGTHAVVLTTLGMAYGQLWTFDRNAPRGWSVVFLPLEQKSSLLEPGGKLVTPSPDPLTGIGMIGPVVVFVDANGRKWQKTTTTRVRVRDDRRPRRRDAWFERQKWFGPLDKALTKRALRGSEKHPGRFPVLALLIDFLWGWRVGSGSRQFQPLNAPIGWRYAATSWRPDQNLDLRPRYSWRGTDSETGQSVHEG